MTVDKLPSSILDGFTGPVGGFSQSPIPGNAQNVQNMLSGLNQFASMVRPLMRGNPQAFAQAFLQSRGIDLNQALQQYGAQATEIQKQLAQIL